MAHSALIRAGVVERDHWCWATSMIPHRVKDPRFERAAYQASRTGKAVRV